MSAPKKECKCSCQGDVDWQAMAKDMYIEFAAEAANNSNRSVDIPSFSEVLDDYRR